MPKKTRKNGKYNTNSMSNSLGIEIKSHGGKAVFHQSYTDDISLNNSDNIHQSKINKLFLG